MTTPPPDVKDRVAFARGRHGESIKRHCAEAGVNYPPDELFLRAFKHEGEIEAWGAGDGQPMKLIKTWPLTARSGVLGPKRREGDRQIPEGCYRVIIFNPQSNFHLSMGLDYPNAADRVHSDPEKPGYDIYIHGNNISIGCLAIGDDMIEELYLLAVDFRNAHKKDPIPVHIFPVRMQGAEWDELRASHPQHLNFWGELEPIYKAFEESRRVPSVKVDANGTYAIEG
jgi:murein L,D-transpeptidase YafK